MAPQVKRAVVVGVGDYLDNHIRPLPGATNDAQELFDRLTADGEFEIEADHFLLDERATGDAIRSAVSDLLWRTEPADLAMLYFSGHGFDDAYGNGFLAPHDMDYDRPMVRGIRMQELRDLMRSAVNKRVILLVLDACKAGIAADEEKGAPPVLTPIGDVFGNLDEDVEARGRVVLASSGPDEKSRERGDWKHEYTDDAPHAHGVMTFHLLDGLNGRAAKDGENVTLSDLHSFLEAELRGAHDQTLTFYGSGLTNADDIRLVTASHYADVRDKVASARSELEKNTPLSLFFAIQILLEIHTQVVNNNEAIAVRKAIDERLLSDLVQVRGFVTMKNLDLEKNCPETLKKFQELFDGLSFESLLKSDRSFLGPMRLLWDATYNQEENSYKAFLQDLGGFEALKGSNQVAPQKASPTSGIRTR